MNGRQLEELKYYLWKRARTKNAPFLKQIASENEHAEMSILFINASTTTSLPPLPIASQQHRNWWDEQQYQHNNMPHLNHNTILTSRRVVPPLN